jgi:hypothetical protein
MRAISKTWPTGNDRVELIADGVVHAIGLNLALAGSIAIMIIAANSTHHDDWSDNANAVEPQFTVSTLDMFIIDAIEIYARASTLFHYAREPLDQPSLGDMQTALRVCRVFEERCPTVWTIVTRRYGSEGSSKSEEELAV